MRKFIAAVVAVGAIALPVSSPTFADDAAEGPADTTVTTEAPPESTEAPPEESTTITTEPPAPDPTSPPEATAPPTPSEVTTTDEAAAADEDAAGEPTTTVANDERPATRVQLLGEEQLAATPEARVVQQEHKVWVCHATAGQGQLKNGYNLIEVDLNATGGPDHQAHATTRPKVNSTFGLLYDYIDVDPNNLPGDCGAPPPPEWTPPDYPELVPPGPCVEQYVEKHTSTWDAETGLWSTWQDWPGAGPRINDGTFDLTGHHNASEYHEQDGDRHFAYVVVSETPITDGDCTPQKVWICHVVNGQGELKNGYNLIEVDASAVDGDGENDHTQHVANDGRRDIIPAPAGAEDDCGGPAENSMTITGVPECVNADEGRWSVTWTFDANSTLASNEWTLIPTATSPAGGTAISVSENRTQVTPIQPSADSFSKGGLATFTFGDTVNTASASVDRPDNCRPCPSGYFRPATPALQDLNVQAVQAPPSDCVLIENSLAVTTSAECLDADGGQWLATFTLDADSTLASNQWTLVPSGFVVNPAGGTAISLGTNRIATSQTTANSKSATFTAAFTSGPNAEQPSGSVYRPDNCRPCPSGYFRPATPALQDLNVQAVQAPPSDCVLIENSGGSDVTSECASPLDGTWKATVTVSAQSNDPSNGVSITIDGDEVVDGGVPVVDQPFSYGGFFSDSVEFDVLATFDRGNGPVGVTLTADKPDDDCRPPTPEYPPIDVETDGTCETGDDTVFVSVETTTYHAVWNAETLRWDKVANEPTSDGYERPLTEQEQAACQPPEKVEETEWLDGIYECGDTEVEQTRTVTTTPYKYEYFGSSDEFESDGLVAAFAVAELEGGAWVLDTDNAVSVEETQTRKLDDDEIIVCTAIEYQLLGPVCVGDIPYIRWSVAGEGFDSALPLTITLSQGSNVVQTIENAPDEGQVIWPGASADPQDWPGWKLNSAGVWVEDPSDAVLREDITVTASVNPETSGTVSYPEATSECADPTPTPPTTTTVPGVTTTAPPATPKGTLPATGGDSMTLAVLASLILILGSGAVIVTRRRKPII